MRVGIVSDTYISEVAELVSTQIRKAFVDVDLILYAGDILAISMLDELEPLAFVLASGGDGDYFYRDR